MASTQVHDFAPSTQTFLNEVQAGLGRESGERTLPSQYLYDETGARLFETICTLDEYYPTRTELGILTQRAGEIAEFVGPSVRLVEPGSGSLQKVRILLDELGSAVKCFVPIDISFEQLEEAARVLDQDYPGLVVEPVCADYTHDLTLPPMPNVDSTVVFYPGSTIGNFEPEAAEAFLRRLGRIAGEGGAVLIGVDLKKSTDILIPAYDDAAGVTAAFTRNLLVRMNREFGANFDTRAFDYRAIYQESPSAVVMQLVSRVDQTVTLAGHDFSFAAGEEITTEWSHKPSLDDFAEMAHRAGLMVAKVWLDDDALFSVQALQPIR